MAATLTRIRLAPGERQARLLPRAQMPRPREGKVQKAILEALRFAPFCFLWRNNTGGGRVEGRQFMRWGLVGSADIIGLVQMQNGIGRFVALEVKRDDREKPTPEQQQFAAFIRNRGGFYAVVWSVEMALAAIKEARGA